MGIADSPAVLQRHRLTVEQYYRMGEAGVFAPGARVDVLLQIEVADSSLEYDRTIKPPLYARHGVGEVRLIDLDNQVVRFFRANDGSSYTGQRLAQRRQLRLQPCLLRPAAPAATAARRAQRLHAPVRAARTTSRCNVPSLPLAALVDGVQLALACALSTRTELHVSEGTID